MEAFRPSAYDFGALFAQAAGARLSQRRVDLEQQQENRAAQEQAFSQQLRAAEEARVQQTFNAQFPLFLSSIEVQKMKVDLEKRSALAMTQLSDIYVNKNEGAFGNKGYLPGGGTEEKVAPPPSSVAPKGPGVKTGPAEVNTLKSGNVTVFPGGGYTKSQSGVQKTLPVSAASKANVTVVAPATMDAAQQAMEDAALEQTARDQASVEANAIQARKAKIARLQAEIAEYEAMKPHGADL